MTVQLDHAGPRREAALGDITVERSQPAAAIAVNTVQATPTNVRVVRFVCFNREALDAYQALLGDQQP